MPVGEIRGETLTRVAYDTQRPLVVAVLDPMIEGLRHLILRLVKPGSEISSARCIVVGLLGWRGIMASCYLLYRVRTPGA